MILLFLEKYVLLKIDVVLKKSLILFYLLLEIYIIVLHVVNKLELIVVFFCTHVRQIHVKIYGYYYYTSANAFVEKACVLYKNTKLLLSIAYCSFV